MLDYVNEDFSALTWDEAISLVIEGRAAFNSMGDWAYGEVVAKERRGQHRLGQPPGHGRLVRARRRQLHPAGGRAEPRERANWLRILGTKEAQEAFNPLKGSIPARTDVNRDIFSPYHQWSMDGFASDALVPSCAHGHGRFARVPAGVLDASAAFVADKDVDTYLTMLTDAAAMDAEATS